MLAGKYSLRPISFSTKIEILGVLEEPFKKLFFLNLIFELSFKKKKKKFVKTTFEYNRTEPQFYPVKGIQRSHNNRKIIFFKIKQTFF